MSMSVETLRWCVTSGGGRLEMIDQTRLPAVVDYVAFDSAEAVATGIRTMIVRGAPAIGVAAAYGVAVEAQRLCEQHDAEFDAQLEKGFAALAARRPTAVNLFWALKRMRTVWDAVKEQPVGAIVERLLAEAHEVTAEDIRINRAMGAFGAELLSDGARVLTHCNAGALATAGHGTALAHGGRGHSRPKEYSNSQASDNEVIIRSGADSSTLTPNSIVKPMLAAFAAAISDPLSPIRIERDKSSPSSSRARNIIPGFGLRSNDSFWYAPTPCTG